MHVRHGPPHEVDELLVVGLVHLDLLQEGRREAVEGDAGREAPAAGLVDRGPVAPRGHVRDLGHRFREVLQKGVAALEEVQIAIVNSMNLAMSQI